MVFFTTGSYTRSGGSGSTVGLGTFDGVFAMPVCTDPHAGTIDIMTNIYIDLFAVKGLTATGPTTITIPLPSGCAGANNIRPIWLPDGALLVEVQGSKFDPYATSIATPNNVKCQLHKYTVTDDGAYALVWRSDETPFMANLVANFPQTPYGYLQPTRDFSWAAWGGGSSIIDLGTGNVSFAPTAPYNDVDISQTYNGFVTSSYFTPSPIVNCLTRHVWPTNLSEMHEAVTFDGTVVRSANWASVPELHTPDAGFALDGHDITQFRGDLFPQVALYTTDLATGHPYVRFGLIDSDTYLPVDFGPSTYMRDIPVDTYIRLPGSGGYGMGALAQSYLPLKRNSDGQLVANLDPTVVDPVFSGNMDNGLTWQTTVDTGNSPHYATDVAFGWIDSDGQYTSDFVHLNFSHEPRIGGGSFRPVLPTGSISGTIDGSRRLFTAV